MTYDHEGGSAAPRIEHRFRTLAPGVAIDEERNLIRIDGKVFSREVFTALANPDPRALYKIQLRSDEIVTVHQVIDKELNARFIQALNLPPANLSANAD